jgi:formylglycine-generating enzyme required for sulfatase activity
MTSKLCWTSFVVMAVVAQVLTACAQRSASPSYAVSPSSPTDSFLDEKPAHAVEIGYAFSLGKYEVTFAEWDACVANAGCTYRPDDNGWGRGDRPVINVSYDDITSQFLPWLNRKFGLTGRRDAFRLPTEAEWEYAARAGTTTAWSCGDNEACLASAAVYRDNSGGRTANVGSKAANPFGLYDMHGNVEELTQDCYKETYAGATADGSAVAGLNSCARAARSGYWSGESRHLRSAFRYSYSPGDRSRFLGFRLARTLP